jgi:hypothetical protein
LVVVVVAEVDEKIPQFLQVNVVVEVVEVVDT